MEALHKHAQSGLDRKSCLLVGFLALMILTLSGLFPLEPRYVVAAMPGPNFRISANPASLTVSIGGSNSSTIILQGTHGFTGTLILTASSNSVGLFADMFPSSLTFSAGTTQRTSMLTVSADPLAVAGNFSVTVSATNGTLTHSVHIPIGVRNPQQSLTIAARCGTASIGEPVTCDASASGGTQPYSFSWSALGGNPSTGTSSSFTTSYQTKGTHMINVTATDSIGATASNSTTITVTPQPLTTVITFSPTNPTVDKLVSFNATVSGGTPPYTLIWNFGDDSPQASGADPTHTFIVKGTYQVTVTVTDANGAADSAGSSVSIAPQAFAIDFSFSPTIPAPGQTVTFTATTTGGTAPYSYGWDFGDGSLGAGSPVEHTYIVGSETTFEVTLNATDNAGNTGTVAHRVTVTAGPLSSNTPTANPSPTGSPPLSPLPAFNWPLAALILGNLLMAALALTQVPTLRRKRRREKED